MGWVIASSVFCNNEMWCFRGQRRIVCCFLVLICLNTLLANGISKHGNNDAPIINHADMIFEAIENNQLATIADKLLNGDSGFVMETNDKKETPLHFAIYQERFDIAEMLLTDIPTKHVKTLIRMKDNSGRTVVHALAMQCNNANNEHLPQLMAPYLNLVETVTDDAGKTAFDIAIERDCVEFVGQFLEKVSCFRFNAQGYTPLHTAKRLGLNSLVGVMIATGRCFVNQTDICNVTVNDLDVNKKDRCDPLPPPFSAAGKHLIVEGQKLPVHCIGSKVPLPFAIQGSNAIECDTDGKWLVSKEATKTSYIADNDLLQMAIDRRVATMMEDVRASLERQLLTRTTKPSDNGMPVGTVLPFAGEKVPDGWLLCDGRSLNEAEYKELHGVIDNKFTTTPKFQHFQLPDLRGRTVIGAGQGSNGGALVQRNFGSYLGTEKHTLTVNEMPSHNHGVIDPGHSHTLSMLHLVAGALSCGRHCNAPQWTGTATSSSMTGISLQLTGSSQSHENMQPSAVLNFIIKAGAYTPKVAPLPTIPPWPKPQYLLGFWPLNAHYGLQDVSENRCDAVTISSSTTTGPFGDAATARIPETPNSPILSVPSAKLRITSSFTVSLFFQKGKDYSDSEKGGGIFEFVDSFGTQKAFQIRYVNHTTIEVSANGNIAGQYQMLQQNGVWTFIALVFDGSTSVFTVYGKHGIVATGSFQVHVFASNSFNNNGVQLGYAARWKQGLQKTDAVSCLAVYSTALNPAEIRQLHDACRTIHGSAPCGATKLPSLLSIPVSTSFARTSKNGQFPYVASLRFNSRHICSATIIDDYWLLTSAVCFSESRDPTFFSIYVGEYDLNKSENHEKKHACAKIIIPKSWPEEDGLIALIQVAEPIDFTNPYVNSVCLPQNNEHSVQSEAATHYVFGWGKNGRPLDHAESIGRYIPGILLTEPESKMMWDNQAAYLSKKDFCFLSSSNAPCSGDEGSPLLAQGHSEDESSTSNRLVQIGVYYKRDANCTLMKPPIFSKIDARYSMWISEQIACAVPGIAYPENCPQNF